MVVLVAVRAGSCGASEVLILGPQQECMTGVCNQYYVCAFLHSLDGTRMCMYLGEVITMCNVYEPATACGCVGSLPNAAKIIP
jgi:hypothetical protein